MMVNLEGFQVQYITDQSGEKNAVILPSEIFFQPLEDLEDLAVAAEPTITHQQLID